jgi:alkylhydroperoxidase family enzyme
VAVSTDWRQARLSAADQAMLEFSEKLTLLPCDMAEADVARLRRHGFTDREILSITLAAAYRNFITRVADALGVELRRGENYTPEILHAFGVTEEEARTTMYGSRLVAEEADDSAAQPISAGSPVEVSQGVCWIETRPDSRRESEDGKSSCLPRNLAWALSLRPEALQATETFARLLGNGGSGLGKRLESLVGLSVAAVLHVPSLIAHHRQALRNAGGDAIGITGRGKALGLDEKERAVEQFCEKLTLLPNPMTRADLDAVRQCGFADQELLTIVASAAFENFLGRVAAGLGVGSEKAIAGLEDRDCSKQT